MALAPYNRHVARNWGPTRRQLAVGLVGAVLAGAGAGCGFLPGRPRREIEVAGSLQLDELLIEATGSGTSARVSDGTDFEWDRFQIFSIGTPAEEINEAAGVTVITDDYYAVQEHLFLFALDGRGVRGIPTSRESFTPPYLDIWFSAETRAYSDDETWLGFEDVEGGASDS
ncbi:hypothetical protein ACFQRD_10840 [Brachybacterium sp. GCM10030268]|uniref:hypothetical protein n=1 Tax=Brachybacterium sp. GCM10030268 TaxID=3273382 RepID=UPI00361B6FCD